MTVTRACASGLQAITLAAAAIERGDADRDHRGWLGLDEQRRGHVAAEAGARRGAARASASRRASDVLGALGQLRPPRRSAAARARDRRAHDRRR